MYERRVVQRTKVLKNAEIILEAGGSNINCTLLDLSDNGACLSLASTYRLPDEFKLTFDRGRSRRSCRVAWRTTVQVGVAFVRVDVDAAEIAADAAGSQGAPPGQ